MASTMYGSSVQADNSRAACAEVKSLTVDRLKKVLRTENLPVSGVKNELQTRLIAHIERCASSGEYAKVDRIRNSLRGLTNFSSNPHPSPYTASTPTSSLSPQYAPPVPRPQPPMPSYNTISSYSPDRVTFKPSPFYTIVKPLGPVHELKARENTRDVKKVDVKLDFGTLEQMRDPNIRIMVFCAVENYGRPAEPADITFPQHGDLKCNEAEVKHNLKGMKNRPGTTRPADITQQLRKSPSYPNSVELVYALTSKKYFLVINMVRKKPLDTLVSELRNRRTPFQNDRVISEMRSRADDPDIVATSTIMSLKDPLQMTRIQTPCRGLSCTHYACFDAAAFLALQEQAPTWSCPHCNKPALWENLAFDHYFDDILRNSGDSVDQVTIEPDGRWHKDSGPPSQVNGQDDDNSSDDDIVEITNTRAALPRLSTSSSIQPSSVSDSTPRRDFATPTPLTPSIPTSANSRSNKRTHSDTIDLTLDDDDDQGPVPSNKRQNVHSAASSSSRLPSITSEPFRFSIPLPAPDPYSTYRYPGY